MRPKDADGIANVVDPDQTAPIDPGQTDLGLHCLPRPVCPKTLIGTLWYMLYLS